MAIASLKIYKILPGTNCGDCGHPTCLSFVNDLIFKGISPETCPHLNTADLEEIKTLVEKGPSDKLESYGQVMFHPLETARKRVAPLNFSYLSATLGGGTAYHSENDQMVLPYLNTRLLVTKKEVLDETGRLLAPGFQTAIYNYLATSARIHPANQWVSFKELPGAVFLSSYFINNVEGLLAAQFASRGETLATLAVKHGGEILDDPAVSPADVKILFPLVPKISVRLLFWDRVEEDSLPPFVTFLFDTGIYLLDLESLTYLVEELVKRLIASL